MTAPDHASAARIVAEACDAARRTIAPQELAEREGIAFRRAGREMRGSCPICGAGQGSRSVFACEGERWRCFGCNERGGDVTDLERELRGGTLLEAARRLTGRDIPSAPAAPRPPRQEKPKGPSAADRIAADIWRQVQPFTGTLAETYLRKRGVHPDVLALAASNLRFHPNAPAAWDKAKRGWISAPAMVVQVVVPGPDGKPVPTGGVHVTYLDRATAGKAQLRDPDDGEFMPAKRMWGPQLSADGRPGGAWLIGPGGIGALSVSEGIETGLSVVTLAERDRRPLRACVALALGRLQGGWARDEDGCIQPHAIAADPAVPAFTWPAPAVGAWNDVLLAVDRDMKPLRVKARTGRGKPCWFVLSGEDRARICARLSVAAWRAAGHPNVRAIRPELNSDFNDQLRRVLALETPR